MTAHRLTTLQRRWIKELETTTKKRAAGELHSENGFCCLGIYAAMRHKDGKAKRTGRKKDGYGYRRIDEHRHMTDEGLLSEGLYTELGLHSPSGSFTRRLQSLNNHYVFTLATLNDDLSVDIEPGFKSIAKFIRENAAAIFVKPPANRKRKQ